MHKSYQDVIDSAVVYGVPLDLTYEDYISNYLPSYGYTDAIRIRATKIGSFRKKYACTQRKSRRPQCGPRLSASEQLGYFAKKYV